MPVPSPHAPTESDAAYFAPLGSVEVPADTELVLGLVHHEDGLAGALARVEAARTAARGSASPPSAGSDAGRRRTGGPVPAGTGPPVRRWVACGAGRATS
ncbi:hypothetical protein [Curtobacterium sp. RRHDQ10]|uniref:hypothetical protein n=1 Tax=Curtobacterium phyllosphaerae TaxID=3413379 RepID=UPI003BEFA8BA